MIDNAHYHALIPEARSFLSELAVNNARDWFVAHKKTYDQRLRDPAQSLLEDVAPHLVSASGTTIKQKLFRPHRDVRFSLDKTPYHVHLHLLWSAPDGRGWFFGISPDYVTAGAGVMEFDKAHLDTWRDVVAGDEGEVLQTLLSDLGGRMDPPALKRVPAPYPTDHPRAELLRRKALVVWFDDLQEQLADDPLAGLLQVFDRLQPLQDWLGDSL